MLCQKHNLTKWLTTYLGFLRNLLHGRNTSYSKLYTHKNVVCVCVCVCVWVCICRKMRTLFRYPTFRPRTHHQTWTSTDWGASAGWLLILHAFIWECAKYNINITCTWYVHGSSNQISHTNCGPPSEVRKVHDSPYNIRHTSPHSPVICVYFSRSTILHQIPVCVCVCVWVGVYVCVCVGGGVSVFTAGGWFSLLEEWMKERTAPDWGY